MPLYCFEDNIMWVALKLLGAARALGAEAIKLRNWLLCFGYTSEGFRVVVANLDDWMDKSSLLWDA